MVENSKNYKELPVVSVHLDLDYCLFSEAPLKTPEDAIKLVADKIYDSSVEKAYAIFMDDALCPICVACVGSGTEVNTQFSIRDILQTAILSNATYVTMLHNHPGISMNRRQVAPSKEDVLVTDSVIKASRYIGLTVYDSIIASGYKKSIFGVTVPVYYSMRENSYKKLQKTYGLKEEEFPSERTQLKWDIKKEDVPGRDLEKDPFQMSEGMEYFRGFPSVNSKDWVDNTMDFGFVTQAQDDANKLASWYRLPEDLMESFSEMDKGQE